VRFLLPISPGSLAAQVQRVGPLRVDAAPGASVTIAFGVRNPSSAPAPAAAAVPRGWPLVSPDADAPVASGASAVRLLATVVPRGAAAGRYVLRYRAGSFADSAIVAVGERRAIDVAVEEAPRFAVAGGEYAAVFRVTNRGNGRAAVRVSAESAPGSAARADVRALDLPAGGSGIVRVTVSTRSTVGATVARVTLHAAADGVAAQAVARVPLVQRSARGGVDVRTLPVTVALRAAPGMDARGGVPGTVAASGALAAGAHVDLFYRGRAAAAPELGEQEQFSLSLRGRRGELRLGDQFWYLSPLTAPGRAGYGAGGRINAGPFWAEGFAERNRFTASAPRVAGGAVGVGGQTASLAANYVSAGDGSAPALSLRGRATPVKGVGADAEAATAAGARAMYARFFAGRPGFGVDVRRMQVDPDFPGEQRGRSLVQANARASLAFAGATAGYEREQRVDTLGRVLAGTELTSSTGYAGVSLGDAVTLQRRMQTREGVNAAGAFARRSDSWIASATLRRGRSSLGGGMEMGTVDDRLDGSSSPFRRTWVRAGTSAGIGSVWAGVERRAGTSVETGAEMDRLLGSFSLQLQPSAGTRVAVLAQAGADEWSDQADGLVDGSVEQRLPGGQTLRLRVRAFPWAQAGRRRPLVFLDWSLPLHLPVGRSGATGTVSGRVVDQETGRPVADALVRVGDRAVVTDGRGRWAIVGLAPGGYTVEIDPVSVGVGRVVVRPDALKVDVAGGREQAVEIGVSRAAKVEGRILVADPEEGDGAVAGAVVELRRGSERRRRVTDGSGRFLFSDLAPGEWTVAVVSADLPPFHALEPGAVSLTLSAGDARTVEMRAVPRKREMVMVSGGDLVLGGASVRGTVPAPSPRPVAPIPGVVTVPVEPRPRAPAERPEMAAAARPWRERGASGFSDWPNDTYVVREGDGDLVAIAWLVYRDGSLWPKLWLANRDILTSPDRLDAGTELLVPPFAPLTADERDAARALRRHR
jgi:hypothetical protein